MFSEIKDQHKICHEHKNKQEKKQGLPLRSPVSPSQKCWHRVILESFLSHSCWAVLSVLSQNTEQPVNIFKKTHISYI